MIIHTTCYTERTIASEYSEYTYIILIYLTLLKIRKCLDHILLYSI